MTIWLFAATAVALLAALIGARSASAAIHVPAGYQVDTPITGVSQPSEIRFARDGTIFVSERAGRILTFDGVNDATPTVFADFRVRVHNFGDRGLLGMILDPDFPASPYVYVLYTRDAIMGGPEPPPALYGDECPDMLEGLHNCVASARVARLQMDPSTGKAKLGGDGLPLETWKVTDWCQQFVSHSIGDLAFDTTGALYAGGGDGASFNLPDYGNKGNPCGDPYMEDNSVKEGGSLRAQDLQTPGTPTDPTGYAGTIIRINPDTGEALPSNPLYGGSDVAARRIYAYGLRNPFRFEFLPGTNDLYIQDTGWNTFEEIDRVPTMPASPTNFGWPCYEGDEKQNAFRYLDVPICENFYNSVQAATVPPFFEYGVTGKVYPGDPCDESLGAASSGIAFYEGNRFPSAERGSLFLANATRGCIWTMKAGKGGVPDPSTVKIFATPDEVGEFSPVDIVEGPDGALYMPSFWGGTIVRISHPDTTPPRTKILKKPPRRAKSKKRRAPARFTFKSSESGSKFQCRVDKGRFRACRSPFGTKVTRGRRHTFQVRAIDAAGNVDRTPAKYRWTPVVPKPGH